MNIVFEAISHSANDEQVLRLSGELKDELMVLAVLGTLSVVNLRAGIAPTVRATDASGWGMAAVSGKLPDVVAAEVHRHSVTRGTWTQLLPPGKAWLRVNEMLDPEDELPDGEPYDVHPLWEVLARCVDYREEWRAEHRRPVHINIGELRAHLREEARLGVTMISKRICYALDSQVALGCLVKGRASSIALNGELMRSIPLVLGSDLYSAYGYVPSKLNRADGPTRDAEPPPPDLALPDWWHALLQGDHAAFDRWIFENQRRLHPDQAEGDLGGPREWHDDDGAEHLDFQGPEPPSDGESDGERAGGEDHGVAQATLGDSDGGGGRGRRDDGDAKHEVMTELTSYMRPVPPSWC